MSTIVRLTLFVLQLLAVVDPQFTVKERETVLRLSPVPQVPDDPSNKYQHNPAAIALGKSIFFDPRFSRDGHTSCATCHSPSLGWSDAGRSLDEGRTRRRAPSLINAPYNRWFAWDGRADSLWAQAFGPLETARENDCHRLMLVATIQRDPALRALYEEAFGIFDELRNNLGLINAINVDSIWPALTAEEQGRVTQVTVNATKAIAAFESTIVSGVAPFDVFVENLRNGLATDTAIMSEASVRGLRLFIGRANCVACHHGPLFSDFEFHDLQLPSKGGEPPTDSGRYGGLSILLKDQFDVGGRYSDLRGDVPSLRNRSDIRSGPQLWGQFKTPTLRELANRHRYMHNGRFKSIDEVVEFYSTLQDRSTNHHDELILQPINLTIQEKADLLAFLDSLNSHIAGSDQRW